MVGVSTIEFKDILANRGIRRNVGSGSKEKTDEGVKLTEKTETFYYLPEWFRKPQSTQR